MWELFRDLVSANINYFNTKLPLAWCNDIFNDYGHKIPFLYLSLQEDTRLEVSKYNENKNTWKTKILVLTLKFEKSFKLSVSSSIKWECWVKSF